MISSTLFFSGSCGAKRLAARLLGRICARLPKYASQVAPVLLVLSRERRHKDNEHDYACFA